MTVIDSRMLRTWSMLGQRATFFAAAMPELAANRPDVRVLTADLATLSALDRFAATYPKQFLNVGIAEQNMIGIAAGLAMAGRCVFATTYAEFLVLRGLEHIRQHLSHMRCNVKLVGTAAGAVVAKSGVSHCATEDLAVMRTLPNMTVLSASDSLEAWKMAFYAASTDAPVYIRLSGTVHCPPVHRADFDFRVGKGIVLRRGTDLAILATGLMVAEALKTAELLEQDSISATVVDIHTIKPFDGALLDELMTNHSLIVTMEEHSVIGGLGGAVAEYKAAKRNTPPQLFLGFQDTFMKPGSQRFVWDQAGITAERAAEKIRSAFRAAE